MVCPALVPDCRTPRGVVRLVRERRFCAARIARFALREIATNGELQNLSCWRLGWTPTWWGAPVPVRGWHLDFLVIAQGHRPTVLWRSLLGVGQTERYIRLRNRGSISYGRVRVGAPAAS